MAMQGHPLAGRSSIDSAFVGQQSQRSPVLVELAVILAACGETRGRERTDYLNGSPKRTAKQRAWLKTEIKTLEARG